MSGDGGGYRRAVVGRWDHRDRLAVLVVALTVAFLVGTTVLVLAVGGEAAAIATEYDSPDGVTHYDTLARARTAAPTGATVVPLAAVRVGDARAVVAGVPGGSTLRAGTGVTRGQAVTETPVTLRGEADAVTVPVDRRGATVFPPAWYVANASLVERLGPTGAVVLAPPDGGAPPETLLVSALAFFLAGTRQAVRLLAVLAGAGAVLVGVTVFSVSRMGVLDRRRTIRIARATGATPRDILLVFAARAALLTGVGVALGYAVGVIATAAAVSTSVTLGLPVSLSIRVSTRAATILLPLLAAVLLVGTFAGVLAARPAVRRPPARLLDPHASASRSGSRSPLALRLLDWRALVPTAATLAAFVAVIVLVAGLGGVAQPLAAPDVATVTEPGSVHPVASAVPAAYATTLRDRGIDASGEILVFAIRDGEPYLVRGANASAFAAVTDTRHVAGHPPSDEDEAVIGRDLARTLGVGVGERLTLGGSTEPAFARVTVVGVYAAPGIYDDQLLVSLPTARHLAGVPDGQVQFVRAARLPQPARASPEADLAAVDVAAPDTVGAGDEVTARITVRNDGLTRAETTLRVTLADQRRTRQLAVPAGATRTVSVRFSAPPPGRYAIRAGEATHRLRVVDPATLQLSVPDPVPPGARPLVRVTTATGRPVAGASIAVGNRTARTGPDGRARVRFAEAGTAELRATTGNRSVTRTVTVAAGTPRRLALSVAVVPSTPTPLVRPTVKLRASNPWNVTRHEAIAVRSGERVGHRSLAVAPGETATRTVEFPRRPPGRYGVTVTENGTERHRLRYRVSGDERVLAALATSGRQGTTGIGQAASVAFGNLRLVLGAIALLAGLMTVGGTTASFARAVHARRRTVGIRRATGATPRQIRRLVLGDAIRIGAVATGVSIVAGLAILAGLAALGVLGAYGVGIPVIPAPWVVVAISLASLGVTVVGAGLAATALIRQSTAALLAGDSRERER